MILQSPTLSKSLATSAAIGIACTLMMVLSDTAEARGNGGARGGFSRSSLASSGSLSSQSVVAERQQSGAAIRARVARNTDGDVASPRSAQSAGGVSSDSGALSASGVKSTEGAGQPGTAGNPDPVSAQEMAAYRQQFNEQNQDNGGSGRDKNDSDDDGDSWDAPLRRPVDPDYSVPASDSDDEGGSPVVPALVVGTVIARNRADDYVDYVNTVDDPAYLTEMPCTIEAAAQLDGVTYYRCEKAWYKRGYQSGSVVYIQTDAPPGY